MQLKPKLPSRKQVAFPWIPNISLLSESRVYVCNVKLPCYTFYGGNVVLVLIRYFFFHCRPLLPWWPLAFLSFSPPLQYFHVVLRTKNVSILFYLLLWLSVALYLVELRWPVTYFLFFCLSLSLYSKFVDMKINLRLILYTTRIQRQFPLFVFVFIDSLVVKTRVAMRFPAKITSSCIYFILHWYACGADGRLVGRTVTWLPKFLESVDHHIFLGMGLRSRALWALLSSSSSSYNHHPHHH